MCLMDVFTIVCTHMLVLLMCMKTEDFDCEGKVRVRVKTSLENRWPSLFLSSWGMWEQPTCGWQHWRKGVLTFRGKTCCLSCFAVSNLQMCLLDPERMVWPISHSLLCEAELWPRAEHDRSPREVVLCWWAPTYGPSAPCWWNPPSCSQPALYCQEPSSSTFHRWSPQTWPGWSDGVRKLLFCFTRLKATRGAVWNGLLQ